MNRARRAPRRGGGEGGPGGAFDIEGAVARIADGRRLVLAVSGGLDSMVLLHAATQRVRERIAMVATFDHGTSPAASAAADHVASVATRFGLPVVIGHARESGAGRSEAVWRAERWAFLRQVAAATNAVVMTAHTSDDQVETVLMRALRGAGARGMAGLYARSEILRPLLPFTRATIAAYAAASDIAWVEDPSNTSLAYFRNRVRLQLLPAARAAHPGFDAELLDVARRAATVRNAVEDVARSLSRVADGILRVDTRLTDRSAPELAVLWPALAARVGCAMDRRGTERVVAFTSAARSGARMPLSGGWEIVRRPEGFELRRRSARRESAAPAPLRPGMRWDSWRFETVASGDGTQTAWTADLPEDAELVVRAWQPGDRMSADIGPRRVKRFLREAKVPGTERAGWPVVVANDEIVWIPGVRRSDAAAVRPGRPGVRYRCELVHR